MNANYNDSSISSSDLVSNNNTASAVSAFLSSASGRPPANNNPLSQARLLDSLLVQEERNQSIRAAQLQRLNALAVDPTMTSNRLSSVSIIDSLLVQEERTQALLAAQLNRLDSGSVDSKAYNNNDALAAIILQQNMQAQNDSNINALSTASQDVLMQHQTSLDVAANLGMGGGIESMNSLQQLSRIGSPSQELAVANFANNSLLPNCNLKQDAQPSAHNQFMPQSFLYSPRAQKGRPATFVSKLHQMLSDLEREPCGARIASFLPEGRAFVIHNPKEFVKNVIPKYFHMSSFASFQRQLNMYSFQQISAGPMKGAYYHELFVRGQPHLCVGIKRVNYKKKEAPEEAVTNR